MISFIKLVLAVWQLSLIIKEAEFAFGLGSKIRRGFGVKTAKRFEEYKTLDEAGEWESVGVMVEQELPSKYQPTTLARGIKCMGCVSFWVGLVWYGLYQLCPEVIMGLSAALSIVMIVTLLHTWMEWLVKRVIGK